jgi:catechol 2,3-dioxygenase-like lactoylglutathione lyase family enzyme
MSLGSYTVSAVVAVSDIDTAKEFYEDKLGLSEGRDAGDGGRTYECGGGSEIHIYPSPENAGKSKATVAGWGVDDLERVVDELSSKGVSFERYDEPIKTDAKGIATVDDSKAAWFKDPDGNTHGLIQA